MGMRLGYGNLSEGVGIFFNNRASFELNNWWRVKFWKENGARSLCMSPFPFYML